jgi:hypothetical protein
LIEACEWSTPRHARLFEAIARRRCDISLKSTTEHAEYTEPERLFFSAISVASVVIPPDQVKLMTH